jgi:hypothetical protein
LDLSTLPTVSLPPTSSESVSAGWLITGLCRAATVFVAAMGGMSAGQASASERGI